MEKQRRGRETIADGLFHQNVHGLIEISVCLPEGLNVLPLILEAKVDQRGQSCRLVVIASAPVGSRIGGWELDHNVHCVVQISIGLPKGVQVCLLVIKSHVTKLHQLQSVLFAIVCRQKIGGCLLAKMICFQDCFSTLLPCPPCPWLCPPDSKR